jgi:hypothetical protein
VEPGDLPQALRARLQLPVDFRLQQVDENRIGHLMAQPGGLPGTPGAEKEEAFFRHSEKATSKFHFAPHFGIAVSIIIKVRGFRQGKLNRQWKWGC